jgi:oxygen-independent coproporphyrinogen-3 oxidase
VHLYIHVPFCARRCSYCDFSIAIRRVVPSDAFVDAVLVDWNQQLQTEPLTRATTLDTLYFGGGTPSHVAPSAIHRLIEAVQTDRPLVEGAEVTLEANPDDVTPEAARTWRAAGINRISLGVQSFDPAVLQWMHRVHAADAPARAIDDLREAGFEDISVDLIFALPAGLLRDWSRDLDLALALRPTHLSLYGLTVENGTPLGRWTARGEAIVAPDESYAEEYLAAHAAFAAAGFEHYEVSNAALPGHRARHNSAYWSRRPFVGLGPSAHSGAGDRRWWNVREWAAYERMAGRGEPLIAGREQLDGEALRLESLYLGLRTVDGLEADLLPAETRRRWCDLAWATETAGRLRLTAEGWLRLDALVAAVA